MPVILVIFFAIWFNVFGRAVSPHTNRWPMEEQQQWHRLFGLSWTDFFRGLPVTVETEKDLSLKKQLLDVLLIRKETARLECRLPDGFQELSTYNLVSFKSHREKLSAWSLAELVGHYVNLRKQASPSMDEADLLPPEEFKLFAVSVRYPQQLVGGDLAMEQVQKGVCDIKYFAGPIRVVVINQLPATEQNAMLHLFSTRAELLTYGVEHYRVRSSETSTLLYDLFRRYQEELHTMPDALEEFTRQTIDRILKQLPPEKRLEGMSPDEILKATSKEDLLKRLSPEDRLKGLSKEDLLKRLSPEDRLNGLALEDRLKGLSPEEREALSRLLKAQNGGS